MGLRKLSEIKLWWKNYDNDDDSNVIKCGKKCDFIDEVSSDWNLIPNQDWFTPVKLRFVWRLTSSSNVRVWNVDTNIDPHINHHILSPWKTLLLHLYDPGN